MSKKINNEKEIEKARFERKWDIVVSLSDGFAGKNNGGSLNAEEIETYACFLYGEGKFEQSVDYYESLSVDLHVFTKDELKNSHSYLMAAITMVKKCNSFPVVLQDAQLLLAHYYFLVHEYELCIETIDSQNLFELDGLSKRSKYIMAEALTCKGLSLEALNKDSVTDDDIIAIYEEARKLSISIAAEEEKSASLKRTGYVTMFTKLLTKSFLRPGDLLVKNGKIDEAIQNYRNFLRLPEMKATARIRKTVCRCLAGLLLSFVSPLSYNAPGNESRLPTSDSMSSLSKPMKRTASLNDSFCPKDEGEEAVLALLLSEATLCKNATVPQRKEDADSKKRLLSETNFLFDLLVLVLSRHNQYNLISQSLEKVMKLAFEEFHLWFQYGLSMVCDGKFKKALLIFQQCHKLQPNNTDVLMFSVKLCLNHLQEYNEAIMYANKVIAITTDPIVEASARLAIGMCHTHLACKASTSGKTHIILREALNSLNIANKLDSNDGEIQFNLAFCQALTKQLPTALSTIKSSLSVNPDHMPSLQLLALLLSAQKKYHEALEVIEAAIEEYPEDFSLLMIKVKLTEECHGSHVALVVCHKALLLWNDLHNTKESCEEFEKIGEIAKSPSYTITNKSINDSKLFDGTPSIKSTKKSLNESVHLDTATLKKISDSTSLLDDDGNGSIAASIRIERTLSEGASGSIAGTANMNLPTAVALLCKLWLITAECFINMGDLTEAIGCILEASSIFPLSPEVLYMKGRYNESKENNTEAKACYESALSVLPTHKAAAQRLGLLYHDEENHVLAEKLLRSCILQDSGNHTAWNDLGLILESVGRHEEAADCFVTSLQLESTSPIIPYTSIPRLFKATDYS